MTKQSVFTTGGTVQAGSGIYLRRPADEDLLLRCRQGYLTYVLTPRQMGKSSLMVEAATRLQEEGIRCVIIDLTALGVHGTGPEQWYLGLLTLIEEQLELGTDVVSWWQDYQHLSLTQRMTKFIQEVLLIEVQKQVVIFVDEIDSTLSLDFTDDFFAAIRYLYVTRAYEENLKRLSFVLIGVATPGDLISDPQRTPFNIGQRVDLNDFTLAEMMPLQKEITERLNLSSGQIKQLMTKVLYWTGGHPYLTQRLCATLLEDVSVQVDKIVKKIFLEQLSQQDNNLQFVRDMLTKRTLNPDEILRVYQEIRCGKIVKNEEQSLVHSHLKLSGIVRQQGNRLVVRNRIYHTVFDRQWIWNSWSDNFWKRYLPILKRAIPLTIVTTATLIGIPIAAQWYRDIQQRTVDQLFAVAHDKFASHPFDAAIDVLAAYRKIKTSSIPLVNISAPASAHETLSDIILNLRENNRLQHDSGVSSLAFSPDYQTIISGDREGKIQISGKKSGRTIRVIKAHERAIYSIAFSPKSKIIVSGSTDQTIKLWNAENGEQIGEPFKGHNGEIYSVAFSPDGKTIASGSLDKTIRLWNVKTHRMIKSFEGHTDAVFSVAFSPDGETIVSGGWDNTVRLWDAKNGKQLIKPIQHPSRVYSVAYSPKDKTIASACKDKKIRLWDTANGQPIGIPLIGHKSNIYSISFSDDGKKIVSGSWDHTVRLWNVKTQQQIDEPFSHDNIVYSVAFKDETIISGSLDKTLRFWDTKNKSSDNSMKTLKNHKDSIYTVAFSPNGKTIVSGSWDKTIRLWNAETGKQIGKEFEGHNSIVFTVAFSPDSKNIVSGDRDGNVKIWDAVTHKLISKLVGHEDAVYTVAFSSDGKTIVSGSWDKTIRLWNAETGKQIGKPLTGHTGPIYTVAVSPNSKIIISSGNDKTIRLWSTETGKQIGKPLEGHQDTVHSVAISPDGKTIVSSGLDQTIRLWDIRDIKTAKQIGEPLIGLNSVVYRAVFSPDGKTIASGDRNKVIQLWDVDTRKRTGHPFKRHKDAIYAVAFSPDGKQIVSGSDDSGGEILLWTLPSSKESLNLQLKLCEKLENHNLLKNPQTENEKAAKKNCDEVITKK